MRGEIGRSHLSQAETASLKDEAYGFPTNHKRERGKQCPCKPGRPYKRRRGTFLWCRLSDSGRRCSASCRSSPFTRCSADEDTQVTMATGATAMVKVR